MTSLTRRLAASVAVATLLTTGALAPAMAETLRFISWQVDDGGTGEWWKSVIAEFEARNPGLNVEFTKVERGAYADTMTTLFAGGSPPDIVHLASFEFQAFADMGWLEPLDGRIAADGIDLDGWAGQSKCEWNGETVCIMMNYFGFIMAYNRAILEAEGLEVPTNWEEFLHVARTTTRDLTGNGIIDQFGTGHETRGGAGQYLTEMLSYILDAGAYWTDADGNITIDTPEMIEGLSRWKTIVGEGLTPVDMSAGEVRTLFADGRIALKLDGPWLYATMQRGAAAADTVVGVPPFNPPLGGSSNILAIPSEISEARKALVWDFMKIAMSPEFQRTYATLGGNTPPSPAADITGVEESIPHFPLLIQTMQAASDAGVDRIPRGLELNYNEFARMIQEETQRMLIMNLDPADVVRTMQALAEPLRN